jgi:hypothetical protein
MNKIFTFMRESNTARFFIPLGIFLIVFGVIMFVINSNNQSYIEIEAIVSNVELSQEEYTDIDGNRVDATYNVTVKYTVDGKEYDAKLDDVSEYNVGDKMKIYYNPKDPSQITQTKSLIIPIVIVVAGIISLVGGIMSGLNAIKRYKKMKEQERGWNNE